VALLPCANIAFSIKRRGKVTYHSEGEHPVLSALVIEEHPDGDPKISSSGLTGGHLARSVLGPDELVMMDPLRQVALVFCCGEKWLRDASICESLADVDFLEVHAFGRSRRSPTRWSIPLAMRRTDGHCLPRSVRRVFPGNLSDNGLPARFTVHVIDVPDRAASYESYATALVQRARPR
jgi:hypothetical protein